MTKHYENQYKENMETLKQIGMTEAVCVVSIFVITKQFKLIILKNIT